MGENREPISLFLVHWNRPLECLETIQALLNQKIPLRIIIVDNASEAAAIETLRDGVGSKAEIVQLEENKGWGPALNVVLREWLESEQNQYCLISAHDAEPSDNCVELLLQAMERDPQIAIACPQYADATVPSLSCLRGVYQAHGVPLTSGTPELVDVPHGTLMLMRRACLSQIGLFDERYFAYGDEHELGARAVRRGWKIALVSGATVTNRGTWTPSVWRSYLFPRNSLLLVHDHCGRLWAWMRAALVLINTLRLMIFSPSDAFAFSAQARLRGVRDYFTGRYGRPHFG